METNLPELPPNTPITTVSAGMSSVVRIPPGKLLFLALDTELNVNTGHGTDPGLATATLLSGDGKTPACSPVVLSTPSNVSCTFQRSYNERIARIDVTTGSLSYGLCGLEGMG